MLILEMIFYYIKKSYAILFLCLYFYASSTARIHFVHIEQGLELSYPESGLALAIIEDSIAIMDKADTDQVDMAAELKSLEFPKQEKIILNLASQRKLEEQKLRNRKNKNKGTELKEGILLKKQDILLLVRQVEVETPLFISALEAEKEYSDLLLEQRLANLKQQDDTKHSLERIGQNLSPGQMNRLMLAEDLGNILSEDWSQLSAADAMAEFSKSMLAGTTVEKTTEHTAEKTHANSGNEKNNNLKNTKNTKLEQDTLEAKIRQQARARNLAAAISLAQNKIETKAFENKNKEKNIFDLFAQKQNSAYENEQRQVANDKSSANSKTSNNRIIKAENAKPRSFAYVDSSIASTHSKNTYDKFEIKSNIALGGGLAFLGEKSKFIIYRQLERDIYEYAKVDISDASYQMEVSSLEGELVATLVDENNRSIGRGTQKIKDIYDKKSQLVLYPLNSGAHVRVLSAYSFENKEIPVNEAEVAIDQSQFVETKQSYYDNENISHSSNFLIRARANGFRSSLKLANTMHAHKVYLYPEKMLESLLQILHDKKVDLKQSEKRAIIWGKVHKNNKSLAGARVFIHSSPNALGPFYFRNGIVNTNVDSTDSSGEFVFINIEEGLHTLSSIHQNLIQHEFTYASENNVSQLEINYSSLVESKIEFQSSNQFTAFDTKIRLAGTDIETSLGTQFKLKLASENSLHYIEMMSDLLHPLTRVGVTANKSFSFWSVPKHSWIRSMANAFGIDDRQSAWTIVYEEDLQFKLQINHGLSNMNQNIAFFDKDGNPVRVESAQAGQIQGAVLYNLEPGLNSIQLYEENGATSFQNKIIQSETMVLNIVQRD